MSVMELGHLLTRSGLTYLEVSSVVCHDSWVTGSEQATSSGRVATFCLLTGFNKSK